MVELVTELTAELTAELTIALAGALTGNYSGDPFVQSKHRYNIQCVCEDALAWWGISTPIYSTQQACKSRARLR